MQLKIKKIISRSKDIFSLILEKPESFTFYPGQYLDVELPIRSPDKLGKSRTFTISASPTEEFLMITTTKSASKFKKTMGNLKKGDNITATHPIGTFILDESSPAIFIAGGIGITPFRSMIKYAIDQKLTTPITLIYSNSDSNFLFKKELEDWRRHLPNLTIIYHNSTQKGHLSKLPPTTHLPIYYLAGPPSFVDDMEKILLDLGIDEINIRYDRFDGY